MAGKHDHAHDASHEGRRRPLAVEVHAFARSNLPPPPARVLEIGAGDGSLARALTDGGYDVLAVDPVPGGPDVRASPLHEVDEPSASFDAAVAVVSLHHVNPLPESLERLAVLLAPGAPLLVDELDVAALDRRAAEWWLEQQRTLGAERTVTADELVAEHRAHLHPLEDILAALAPRFRVGTPVRGAYLYRWDLGASFRAPEEELIAHARIPAVGARVIAHRRS